MKIYTVTANTYTDGYGASIRFFLATDSELKADKEKERLEKKGYYVKVIETELNQRADIYLGGYVE